MDQQYLWWLYLRAKQDLILELIERVYSLIIHALETTDVELANVLLSEAKDVLTRAREHYSILEDFFPHLKVTQHLGERLSEVVEDYQRVSNLVCESEKQTGIMPASS